MVEPLEGVGVAGGPGFGEHHRQSLSGGRLISRSLPRIESTRLAALAGLDRLGVDHGGRRLRVASGPDPEPAA